MLLLESNCRHVSNCLQQHGAAALTLYLKLSLHLAEASNRNHNPMQGMYIHAVCVTPSAHTFTHTLAYHTCRQGLFMMPQAAPECHISNPGLYTRTRTHTNPAAHTSHKRRTNWQGETPSGCGADTVKSAARMCEHKRPDQTLQPNHRPPPAWHVCADAHARETACAAHRKNPSAAAPNHYDNPVP